MLYSVSFPKMISENDLKKKPYKRSIETSKKCPLCRKEINSMKSQEVIRLPWYRSISTGIKQTILFQSLEKCFIEVITCTIFRQIEWYLSG